MLKKHTIRHKMYMVLERESHSKLAELVHYFLMLLILLTVISVILESDDEIYLKYKNIFKVLEIVSIVVFSLEYILRVWCCSEIKKFNRIKGKIRYIFTPMAIIDLLAVLPALLGLFFSREIMVLRALRLIRIFKLTRYSRSINLLLSVLKNEIANISSAYFVLTILILIAATGIYLVESDIQPDVFGSIPKAIWWATVTLSTVGYGDVVPLSFAGKSFGIIILMSGIGMAALPAGILASGYTKEINRRKQKFKNKVIDYFSDGVLDDRERRKLKLLAHDLSISNQEMITVIREIKYKQLKLTELICPHCDNPIEIEHYSDHIKLKANLKKINKGLSATDQT